MAKKPKYFEMFLMSTPMGMQKHNVKILIVQIVRLSMALKNVRQKYENV